MKRLALLALLAAACTRGGQKPEDALAGLVDAWKRAGLEVTAFQPADDKPVGGVCRGGTVGGLDTTFCLFPDPEAAKRVEKAGYALVGEATGVSLASRNTLLVVADRRKVDLNGKRMGEVVKTFRAY